MKLTALLLLSLATAAPAQMMTNTATGETATRAAIAPRDVVNVPPEWFTSRGWQEFTAAQQEAWDAARQAEADAAQAARLSTLVQAYAPMVGVLRANLVAVGHDLPCNATAVTIDLMGRAAAGALSQAERAAKDDIFQLYTLLQKSGLTDSDIAAIWENIKP